MKDCGSTMQTFASLSLKYCKHQESVKTRPFLAFCIYPFMLQSFAFHVSNFALFLSEVGVPPAESLFRSRASFFLLPLKWYASMITFKQNYALMLFSCCFWCHLCWWFSKYFVNSLMFLSNIVPIRVIWAGQTVAWTNSCTKKMFSGQFLEVFDCTDLE